MSEDKALALLITSQDLEPGPKAQSGAGRPGRESRMGGREERPGEPRRHGGHFPPRCPSAGLSGFPQFWGSRYSCEPSLPSAAALAWRALLDPPWPFRALRPALARPGLRAPAEAEPQPGKAGHRRFA